MNKSNEEIHAVNHRNVLKACILKTSLPYNFDGIAEDKYQQDRTSFANPTQSNPIQGKMRNLVTIKPPHGLLDSGQLL
jgi:hypothetical protein